MQEDKESKAEKVRKIPIWLIVLGGLLLVALACLATGAFMNALSDSPVLPTAAARAVVEALPGLPLGRPTKTPTPLPTHTPMAPQPGGRSAGDPYIPELGNTGYDVQHYSIQLALDPASDHVEGATSIEALSTITGLSEISLDFVGFDVGAVTVNGIAAGFSREGKKLIVALPELQPANAPFTLVITYRGSPLFEPSPYLRFVDHLGLHYPDGESIFTIAEPDGARYWFPANDHPRDKATFRFELLVPAGLEAVANGELVAENQAALPNGDLGSLFIWEHNYPMAPYLALVAVGPYERLEGRSPGGIPLRHYILPEQKEEIIEATNEIGPALDWMADLFGPYPFETFGYVTAKVPGGSMESQTMVLLSDNMIGRKTAVHELAHMWFGNWVSLDTWAEMWRNEGFATYIQLMWENRQDSEDLELQMIALNSVVEGNNKQYPLDQPPPEYLFELNVYFQGALAAHALRQEIGDEAFFAGLRNYFARYGGGTASDDQFQSIMEQAAGVPLDDFFAAWFPPG
jgi:aminopeptidase N